MYALREALANVCREGLQNSIERHINASNHFQMGIEALGLEMYVDNVNQRFPTINVIKVPDGINSQLIIDYALKKYFVISFCIYSIRVLFYEKQIFFSITQIFARNCRWTWSDKRQSISGRFNG